MDVELEDSFASEFKRIEKHLPQVDEIFSSPLKRCLTLAEHLAVMTEVKVDSRLTEMHFGRWQGHNWDDIPRTEIDTWADNFFDYQGHEGESVMDLRTRVAGFLDELDGNQNQLIVSHAGVIRSAIALRTNSDERQIQVAYGELVRID